MLPRAFVVGTAGHIDHGKTSLVRALTGVDLDSLPEERDRGITIALGFTAMALPGGRVASFVDCPGHERLVRTMIAGACGIDAVVLCVSAVEGVMPQTREHLDILELLGVSQGLVVLTMVDLVDEEMVELAEEDARDTVAGTFLEGAPILHTSAQTRAGIEDLIAALDALQPEERSEEGPFRLPVDRAFSQKGFGTVITGTVQSGRVSEGEDLLLLPQGESVRVRGVQVHGEKQKGSRVGLRTALNLAGVDREELPRGTVVAGPGVAVTSILDLRFRQLPSAPTVQSGDRVRLLLGTSEVMAVAYVLGPGFLQLRTAEPVACLPQDRFVLRRESPVTTLGGGVVLDPWAPKLKRKDFDRGARELARLDAGDLGVWLERAGPEGLHRDQARQRGIEGGQPLADRVFAEGIRAQLDAALEKAIDGWHSEHPLAVGAAKKALQRGMLEALSPACFDALVRNATERGVLAVDGSRVRRPGFEVVLDAAQEAVQKSLYGRIAELGLDGLKQSEAVAELPDGEALVAYGLERDRLTKIGDRLYITERLRQLVETVTQVLATEGELSPQRFKELTSLTRKGAIPLLEWLDAQKITRRQGDVRVAR